ncbi:histone H1-like protein [Zunongwangia atlantica 22II14-10F7]|uniref:Histone H1-like protein n=2 Tax=Zunongwangia TaxID=417127 RepID=A0A1Y1T9Z8_9FLAO|nr:histone H1-like protein [Zunongwangia atlantica 22II14-10F7]
MSFKVEYYFIFACLINLLNKNNMKELVENINETFEAFKTDAEAQLESGNKAAGTRARKTSLALEKLLKEFRKESIAASKK